MAILCTNGQNYEVGTSIALWGNPTVADLQEAKNCGINYVEVTLNSCYRGVSEDEVEPRVRAMKAKIDSAGLSVWSIHLPFSRTLDISVIDDTAREANVRFIAKMIALSAIFKPSRLVQHASSEPVDDADREQRIVNASHSIATLKNYADKIGAQLCIENLARTCLGNTPEELLRIIGNTPDVGICFDLNHYASGTTEYFVRVAGAKIATIHASDFDGKNECHWLPAQGIIDWGQFVKNLAGTGYRGVFMYEASKNKSSKVKLTPQQVVDSFNVIKTAYNNKK
jgi:sugar phosphate isomerase/epimerase